MTDAKEISLAAIFASLYAALLTFLAPISFGPIQLRIADCLLPLAALLGWPIIWGATIGCLVGNAAGGIIAFGMIEPMDVLFGSLANLVAAFLIFTLRRRSLVGCILGSLAIGFIVGGYLWLFLPPPDLFGISMPAWAAMIFSISASTLVAVAIIGYFLLLALSNPNFVEPMKARGLKVYI